MKKIVGLILTGVLLTSVGCANTANKAESTKVESAISSESQKDTAKESDAAKKEGGYTHIDQETAKQMMANEDGHVIVDVRSQEEYNEGHIPGAIVIPNESIGTEQPKELPDLNQVILVYCRSLQIWDIPMSMSLAVLRIGQAKLKNPIISTKNLCCKKRLYRKNT